ncbi:MAG: NAD(P)/FAD-dependent oxidoreductase [Ruminococcaceae bacterium]|jgi:hypothetical protein|nr:NAD(P)/FAD-dependent oxidoreductase [Oscillospiraceae bacterium]
MIHIIVIGAGPAGMMASIAAAEAGASVTLLERNPFPGKKLRITGKGRCNVTNNCSPREVVEAVTANPKFLYGAVNRFSPSDTMAFFENAGVLLKTERGRRVFPVSDKAADIQGAMVRRLKESGVRLLCDTRVTGLTPPDAESGELPRQTGWTVSAERSGKKTSFSADRVILCTGGVSYPLTGSDGDGHRMLRSLGVGVTELKPSLVPIETKENFAPLSGLTLKNVTLTAWLGDAAVYSEMGEMLFTHFGVSGPLVLSASANMQKRPVTDYRLTVNLKPALTPEELDKRIRSDFEKYAAKDFVNALADLLPKAMIPYVVKQSGVDPRKKTGEVTKEERAALLETLTAFRIVPTGFRPVAEAIVTAGGADVKELDPKTMEFRRYPGLFAAGELLDVNAYTGGYNLQIAFSTAYVAGISAAREEDGIQNEE